MKYCAVVAFKMQHLFNFVLPLLVLNTASAQLPSPPHQSAVAIDGVGGGVCPSEQVLAEKQAELHGELIGVLSRTFTSPQCPCGGPGQWTRIAHLDMSDPSQQCPSNWSLITTPVRVCRSSIATGPLCDSAIFPSGGRQYSRVCGRVNGYQQGNTDAFGWIVPNIPRTLEDAYVDGISLTHGPSGSRQHIWSFASGLDQANHHISNTSYCPCSVEGWSFQLPTFVGGNYFCDSGNTSPQHPGGVVYSQDPLWDGQGCAFGTCCEFNNPPWFCTTLPQPTTDDIEMRLCRDESNLTEDVIVFLVDINIA